MSKSKVAPSEQLSMVIDPHRHLSHLGAEGRACPEGPPRPKSSKRSGGSLSVRICSPQAPHSVAALVAECGEFHIGPASRGSHF